MTDTSEPSAPLATPLSRRGFLVSATIAAGGLAACTSTPRVQEAPRERIDREVQEAQSLLYSSVPGAQELAGIAEGLLIIPKIRKVGFFAMCIFLGMVYGFVFTVFPLSFIVVLALPILALLLTALGRVLGRLVSG